MFLNLANLKVNNKIGFILMTILLCVVYGCIYWMFGTREHFNFITTSSTHLTFIDALYFAFTTNTTIGYGDITPKSQFMRFITITNAISIMVLFVYSNFGQ